MIIVGNRDKELLFNITTEGIKNNDIVFFLRIMINDVDYGFKGSITGDGRIRVIIPPRENFIPFVDTSKIYTTRLETIGEGKYFSIPWEGELQFEAAPTVMAKLANISNSDENLTNTINKEDDRGIGVELQDLDDDDLEEDEEDDDLEEDELNDTSSLEDELNDMDVVLTLPKKQQKESINSKQSSKKSRSLVEEVLTMRTHKPKINPNKIK